MQRDQRAETDPRDAMPTKPSVLRLTQGSKLAGRSRQGWRAVGLPPRKSEEARVSAGDTKKAPTIAKTQGKSEKDVNNTLSLFI